jgi:hypothetical protein
MAKPSAADAAESDGQPAAAGELSPGRKALLLRLDPAVWDAVRRWAEDDFRSVNGQIEYLLRDALRRAGRAAKKPP